jgi:hypothetical protein
MARRPAGLDAAARGDEWVYRGLSAFLNLPDYQSSHAASSKPSALEGAAHGFTRDSGFRTATVLPLLWC